MSAPTWSAVSDDTASLLDLLADDGTLSVEAQWDLFVDMVEGTAFQGYLIHGDYIVNPNRLRDRINGRIKPQRVGAFTHRALRAGLVEHTGRWITSTDTKGRNAGKPCREMRWIGGDQ